jgi:predicted nuclease of predicted toxin-antitoxin system
LSNNTRQQLLHALLADQAKDSDISDLLRRIHVLRQNGLLTGGEFSTENLTYKVLRSLNYLQRLYDARVKGRDNRLSVR